MCGHPTATADVLARLAAWGLAVVSLVIIVVVVFDL